MFVYTTSDVHRQLSTHLMVEYHESVTFFRNIRLGTIFLLNMKRANKGMKRINGLPLSPVHVLGDTVAPTRT